MGRKTSTLLGYKVAYNMRTLAEFERLQGGPGSELNLSSIADQVNIARAMIITGEGSEPENLEQILWEADPVEFLQALNGLDFFRALQQNGGGVVSGNVTEPAADRPATAAPGKGNTRGHKREKT